MGPKFEASFAGIGLNINQTRFAPDIPNPVSLIHILRHEIVLRDALQTLCGFLDIRYESLRHHGHAVLDREFDRNLLGFDQQRSFIRNGENLHGTVRGVDDSGLLKVELETGKTECFCHGEIELVI
jgi:BirA family biotin operon repressor/biotin-[acetyl-CoA-carboxylase] ligase